MAQPAAIPTEVLSIACIGRMFSALIQIAIADVATPTIAVVVATLNTWATTFRQPQLLCGTRLFLPRQAFVLHEAEDDDDPEQSVPP